MSSSMKKKDTQEPENFEYRAADKARVSSSPSTLNIELLKLSWISKPRKLSKRSKIRKLSKLSKHSKLSKQSKQSKLK